MCDMKESGLTGISHQHFNVPFFQREIPQTIVGRFNQMRESASQSKWLRLWVKCNLLIITTNMQSSNRCFVWMPPQCRLHHAEITSNKCLIKPNKRIIINDETHKQHVINAKDKHIRPVFLLLLFLFWCCWQILLSI